MATSEPNLFKATTAGDAAVEGLVHGIIAGVAMAAYLVVAGLLGGDSPATMLGRFGLGSEASPIAGVLGHLAVSAVYGIIWGLIWRSVHHRSGVPGSLAGIAYGLVLFLGSQVLLPAAGSPRAAVPAVHLAVAHVIYGLVLGLWSGR